MSEALEVEAARRFPSDGLGTSLEIAFMGGMQQGVVAGRTVTESERFEAMLAMADQMRTGYCQTDMENMFDAAAQVIGLRVERQS